MKLINQEWIGDYRALAVIDAIEGFQGNARFVGGCVRDSILGKEIQDIDIATDLVPEKVIEALESFNGCNIKVIPTGLKHGTITAVVGNKSYEITTLRADVSCDGRHADVKFTTNWQVDASRRDFTFNALYCDKEGVVYDYFTGIDDLKSRKLRFIGRAEERIEEDFLRILRAFRFHAAICQGQLSEEIIAVCKKHAHKIQLLSGERIRDEFFKILSCQNPTEILITMQKSNVLQQIIPEEISCNILLAQALQDVDPIVKLAAILRTSSNDKDKLGHKISNILRLSNKQKDKMLTLLKANLSLPLSIFEQKKNIMFFGHKLYCNVIKIQHIELNIKSLTKTTSTLAVHATKNSHSIELKEYLAFADSFQIPIFPISGDDLIKMGYVVGKKLGSSLKLIKDYWESNFYSLTKDQLLNYAQKLLNKK